MNEPRAAHGRRAPTTFLAGLTVLELGDGIAGGAAGATLRSLGADVWTVWDPASLHRRSRPSAARGPSALSVILDRHKNLIADIDLDTDSLRTLIGDGVDGRPFDVVIADRTSMGRAWAALPTAASYVDFVDRVNPGGWVTISAFGLTGNRCDDFGTELTIGAAAGTVKAVHDLVSGRPMKLAGCQALLSAGQAAALAACHAIDLARDGEAIHLDLSAVEATIATGPTLEIGAVLLNAGGPGGAQRYGAPASFYPCRDGEVRISAMEDHQWHGVVAAMGSPDWADRFATTELRVDGAREIDEHVAAWTRTMGKSDVESLLQHHGVPATAVYSAAEVLDSPQLRYRSAWEPLEVGDGAVTRIVGEPFRVLPPDTPTVPRDRQPTLRGLNVLEASHVLAVPTAGSLLGALGANVTKLEDLQRIDMYRRRGPYVDGVAGLNRSAYFTLANHSKSSIAFDVDDQPDRLADLLDQCDVVIENLGGRRAKRFGVDAAEAVRRRSDVFAVSSSGFGQEGPYATYRAYAYNLQAACCLGALTRAADGDMAAIDLPWADLVSAYYLATIVAAWAVGSADNVGAGIDFAMADLIIGRFNEFIAEAARASGGSVSFEVANDQFPYAPNGVYATDDGWIAVSVADDDRYRELAEELGGPSELHDVRFSTVEGRYEARRELDGLLEARTRSRCADSLASALRARGIDADTVVSPRDLPDSADLASREFFVRIKHPEIGERRLIGLPWRPFGGPSLALGAPPVLAAAPE
jgi:crotonobetainyl-CoA:carnitine CoA-transferase CaiB-like acyl-CoA transferase